MGSVGFKEWALVCAALGRGEQCVILRKGGLAEGRAGFSFEKREFFLFPTYFHEQVEKVRGLTSEIAQPGDGEIEIKYCAKVECATVVTAWETVLALERFHVLRQEVVRERFNYDEAKGVHVAFVRVFRLQPAWIFPDEPRYGGCRSWVKLPQLPADLEIRPVLDEAEHSRRKAFVGEAVSFPCF